MSGEPAPEPIQVLPARVRGVQGQRAGLASRILANAVDVVVVLLVLGGGYLGVVAVRFFWSPRSFTIPSPSFGLTLALGAGVTVVYFSLAWVMSGRTVGDRVIGLRVLDHRGERLPAVLAAARAAFCVALPIGLLWVAVSPGNRSVQDVFLRTSVVYDWLTATRPD